MGFYKIGDEIPVNIYYDADGNKQLCEKCHKPTNTIYIKKGNVSLICECDDMETSDE